MRQTRNSYAGQAICPPFLPIGVTTFASVSGMRTVKCFSPTVRSRCCSFIDAALSRAGTVAGWLAIEAARARPAPGVVGIDSWEPALALARKKLAQSDFAERVELRSQRAVEHSMTTRHLFVGVAFRTIYRCRNRGDSTGGHSPSTRARRLAHIGLHARPTDALGEALTNLRIVRSGSHPCSNGPGFQPSRFPSGIT